MDVRIVKRAVYCRDDGIIIILALLYYVFVLYIYNGGTKVATQHPVYPCTILRIASIVAIDAVPFFFPTAVPLALARLAPGLPVDYLLSPLRCKFLCQLSNVSG